MPSLSNSPAWKQFSLAVLNIPSKPDALRVITAAELEIDLTMQRSSAALTEAAQALLNQQGFDQYRRELFEGAAINWTEHRAAWHTALRATNPPEPVAEAITTERLRLTRFVEEVNARNQYRNVVHLGIGGSDWGPRLAFDSLAGQGTRRTLRFASNVDAHAISAALEGLDAHDTLVIISSKSFTTIESLANAACAIDWLRASGVPNPLDHFAAVTANPQAARNFGINDDRIFQFWDWVGGRYSLWSSIGLPIALGLGIDALNDMRAGAAAMDEHFLTAPIEHNAPVQMALSAVANRSVLGYGSFALCPYDARLSTLIPWLQQLEMESLGKATLRDGSTLDVPSSPAVWGMPGTDSQHTFFQWLHQDGKGAPVDFILCATPDHRHTRHHRLLIANCLAQRAALLEGKSYEQSLKEVRKTEQDPEKAAVLARHHVHPGGRPSTLIVLPKLEARQLGALLALYEHKVFTEGVLWGINPFDQWGVEFGKRLAGDIERRLDALGSDPAVSPYDPSTAYWVRKLASGG
jgi:glucose-6-phosphate isomerase